MVNIKNQRNLCSRCSGWPHPWKTSTELLCARTGDKISLVLPVQLWQSWTNRWAERFSSLNTSKGKGCTSRTHFQEMGDAEGCQGFSFARRLLTPVLSHSATTDPHFVPCIFYLRNRIPEQWLCLFEYRHFTAHITNPVPSCNCTSPAFSRAFLLLLIMPSPERSFSVPVSKLSSGPNHCLEL